MSNSQSFTCSGLYVIKNFFSAELCAKLRREIDVCSGTRAHVVDGAISKLDESMRRARQVRISEMTRLVVKEHLTMLKPTLEDYYQLTLTDCDRPQFLVYEQGDFYLPHRDKAVEDEAPEPVRRRQLSAVLFLNRESEEPAPSSYGGGWLTLYGVIDDPGWDGAGFPLLSREGLLVVFRSDVLHEVRTVTHGRRYSVVSWFF